MSGRKNDNIRLHQMLYNELLKLLKLKIDPLIIKNFKMALKLTIFTNQSQHLRNLASIINLYANLIVVLKRVIYTQFTKIINKKLKPWVIILHFNLVKHREIIIAKHHSSYSSTGPKGTLTTLVHAMYKQT